MDARHDGTDAFLAIFPHILRHALFAFRAVRDPGRHDDCVQEVLAICWLWCCRLHEKGKDARDFPTALAGYATRQVKCGRRFAGGKLGLKDALNPVAHARHGFACQSLPEHQSTAQAAPWMEQLVDQPGSRVAQLAAFRIDFPAWLASLGDRKAAIAEDMATGESTLVLAGRHGVSPARISQLRRELCGDWHAFTSPPA